MVAMVSIDGIYSMVRTSVQLSTETKDKLALCAKAKGETYEEIILRLIEVYNNRRDDALEKEFTKFNSAVQRKVKGVKTRD